jgi:hypothetical protein
MRGHGQMELPWFVSHTAAAASLRGGPCFDRLPSVGQLRTRCMLTAPRASAWPPPPVPQWADDLGSRAQQALADLQQSVDALIPAEGTEAPAPKVRPRCAAPRRIVPSGGCPPGSRAAAPRAMLWRGLLRLPFWRGPRSPSADSLPPLPCLQAPAAADASAMAALALLDGASTALRAANARFAAEFGVAAWPNAAVAAGAGAVAGAAGQGAAAAQARLAEEHLRSFMQQMDAEEQREAKAGAARAAAAAAAAAMRDASERSARAAAAAAAADAERALAAAARGGGS